MSFTAGIWHTPQHATQRGDELEGEEQPSAGAVEMRSCRTAPTGFFVYSSSQNHGSIRLRFSVASASRIIWNTNRAAEGDHKRARE